MDYATEATTVGSKIEQPSVRPLYAQPALFMTVRREIAEPRRETGAWSPEDPMRTRAVR